MTDLNNKSPGGMLAYCDYLMSKGYATAAQINPWRTAIQKVFETVEGQGWEELDLATIDVDEYLARFQTLAGAQYKAESISAYKRRIRNAMDAHEHYLSTGKPPTFRQGGRPKSESKGSASSSVVSMERDHETVASRAKPGMHEFQYPLGDGRMLKLTMPPRMKADDVNRICAFIRTLQDDAAEPRQIPLHTGEDHSLAA